MGYTSSSSSSNTITTTSSNPTYKAYPVRWYVLFVYSLVSLIQSMIWLTYSPVAETTKRYYKLCTTEAECTNESGPG